MHKITDDVTQCITPQRRHGRRCRPRPSPRPTRSAARRGRRLIAGRHRAAAGGDEGSGAEEGSVSPCRRRGGRKDRATVASPSRAKRRARRRRRAECRPTTNWSPRRRPRKQHAHSRQNALPSARAASGAPAHRRSHQRPLDQHAPSGARARRDRDGQGGRRVFRANGKPSRLAATPAESLGAVENSEATAEGDASAAARPQGSPKRHGIRPLRICECVWLDEMRPP